MEKIIQSPGKYVQGAGELNKLAQRVADFGDAALVVLSGTMMRTKNDSLKQEFEDAGIKYVSENSAANAPKPKSTGSAP